MSPTSEIEALHAEIKALQAQIQGVSSKQIQPSNAENEALHAKIEETQPSNADIEAIYTEIKALQPKIQGISSKHVKYALQTLLSYIGASAKDSPIEILRKWLSHIESTKTVTKVFCLVLPILASVCD
jgi:SMC interacting uncharacterized protein involved in chromosome segregation